MSHHIYNTKAFVIKSMPAREADRSYILFTEELGLVKANAQSIRLAKSKLKGHLQNFYFADISLVRGRELWRITSAEVRMLAPFSKNLDALYTAKNIFSLLARLIHGEEKSNHLFAVIESWYRFISSDSGEKADLKTAEVLIVLRILYVLGYFKKSPALAAFAEETEISKEILSDFKKEQIHATKEINAALKETHL